MGARLLTTYAEIQKTVEWNNCKNNRKQMSTGMADSAILHFEKKKKKNI
jgi:hypothetical protein